jgi:GGDEF domain-containing protein
VLTTWLALAAAALAVAALALVGLLLLRLRSERDGARRPAEPAPEPPSEPAVVESPPAAPDALDAALERTLGAARAAVDADAALLVLDAPGATPVVATVGLGQEESGQLAGSLPPLAPSARSVTLTYPVPPTADDAAKPTRCGLAVPMRAGGRQLGLLAALAREARDFSDDDVDALERVAEQHAESLAHSLAARIDVENATRDPATGFLAAAAFAAALARAVGEARVSGRAFSLVLVELDMLRQLGAEEAVEAVMADDADRIRRVLRQEDVAGRPGPTSVAVLLPGTEADEARGLAAALEAAVASRPVGGAAGRRPSTSVATLGPGDTPDTLLERARRAFAAGRTTP